MSISINVTPAASGGTFTVGSTSSQNVTLEVTGGIGPPGTDVALAAGTGISIVTVNNTATISSTVEAAANLADLGDVTLGNVTSGQVLEWNGTAWTAGTDSTLSLATATPSNLGTGNVGFSSEAARADHVHNLPSLSELSDVALGSLSSGQVLAYNGTAWTAAADNALTLSTSTGSDLGTAAIGTSSEAARADHVHNLPTFAEITNGTATVTGNLTLNASTGSVTLNGGTAGSASLTLNCEQNTHGVTIQGPPHLAGATYTLTLPTSDGAANQVLQTDGSGSLSWANQSAGGGGITWATEPAASNSTGTAGQIAYGSGFFYLHDGTEWRRAALSTFGVESPTITITTQPQDLTLADGGSGSFTVAASVSDGSTASYQWQNSDDSGATWDTLTGSTGTTYSLSGVSTLDNGTQYRAIVSAAGASDVTSNVATLTVTAPETYDLLAESGDRLMTEAGDSLDHDGGGGGGSGGGSGTAWTQVGADIDGGAASNELGPVALNSNGTVMVVGEPGYDGGGLTNSGLVTVYADNGTAWVQRGLSFAGAFNYSYRGQKVDISADGNAVVLSETNMGGGTTHGWARRFVYDGTSWTQSPNGSAVPNTGSNRQIALAISGDGDRVAMVYRNTVLQTGALMVWDVSAGTWDYVNSGDVLWFFSSASSTNVLAVALNIDGSVVCVGDPQTGYASIWEDTGTLWAGRGANAAPNNNNYASIIGSNSDQFGYSVSLTSNGNRLAVGAPYGDSGGTDRGYVRVYDWSGSAWSQVGGDITGVNNYDYAGWSVDISSDGSRVVVGLRGADGNGSNSGTTRIYDYNGTAWVQVGGDVEGSAGNDYSGSFVTISGDGTRVGIGAPGNDDGGADAGQVRVFEAS